MTNWLVEYCLYFFIGKLGEVHPLYTAERSFNLCDVYTGTGYRGPPHLGHVGAFFNTDGIQIILFRLDQSRQCIFC